jgi:hypothetical protein
LSNHTIPILHTLVAAPLEGGPRRLVHGRGLYGHRLNQVTFARCRACDAFTRTYQSQQSYTHTHSCLVSHPHHTAHTRTVNSGTHTVSIRTRTAYPRSQHAQRTLSRLEHRTRAANTYSHDVHKRPLTTTCSGYFSQHAVARTRGHVTFPGTKRQHYTPQWLKPTPQNTRSHQRQSSQAQPTPEAPTQSLRPIPHALCCQH